MNVIASLSRSVFILLLAYSSVSVFASDKIELQLEQAKTHLKSSNVADAEALYSQILEAQDASPSQHGDALTGMASVADMQRDNQRLRSYAEQALGHAERYPELGQQKAYALLLLGVYFANIDDEPEATRHYQQALEIAGDLPGEQSILPDVLINLAINSSIRGDFSGAEQYLLEALDIIRDGPGSPSTEVRILANLAYVYGTRNEVTRARDVYREIVEIARQEEPDSLVLANRLSNLGSMEQRSGNVDAATVALAEALEIQTRLAPDSLDIARTYYAMAEIAEKQGQLELALEHYQNSLELARAATDGAQITFPLRGVSGVLISLKRYDEALPLLQEAVERAATHTPLSTQHARSLGKLGLLHYQRGDFENTITTLEQAVDILEIQYTMLGGSAITLAEFKDQFESIYATLAEVYLQIGSSDKALMSLERYRERALLINLDLSEAALALETPDQQALRTQISDLFSQLEGASGSESEREIMRTRLLVLQRKLNQPGGEHGPGPIIKSLELAQQELQADDRILFYNIGQDRRMVFVISSKTVNVVDLQVSEQQLVEQVGRIRTLLQTPASADKNVQSVSTELFDMLIAPLADYLPAQGRLVVIPHKILQLLPFSVIYQADRQEYLLQNYEIIQAGSLSSVKKNQQNPSEHTPLFAAFAYSGNDQLTDVRGQTLGQIRGAEKEVESAAAALNMPSKLFTGMAARKAQLSEIGNASILHFATHAVIDMSAPRDSYLVLAPDSDDDGHLSLWAIANGPKLSAGLVVLSACNTAVGPDYAGEGVLGLSKAFSLAGAGGVAASLWPVADRSTTVLMQQFYLRLAAGTSAASALQQAQLQLLETRPGLLARQLLRQRDYHHPYYWAPFIIDRF